MSILGNRVLRREDPKFLTSGGNYIEDLDLRQRTLLIRNGKGGKDRLVPVPARAAAALDTY